MKGKFRYRMCYEKGEQVRYISHLDFVRVINRAIRRSHLPVTYTQGFNPHPVFRIAMPISVGVTSECEYMEIDMEEYIEPQKAADAFNAIMPQGLNIKGACLLHEALQDFNAITTARYRVCVEMTNENTPDLVSFMGLDEVVMLKKSKSKEKEVNIRPDIHELTIDSKEGNIICFNIEVSSGSSYNLKPELVVDAMKKHLDAFDYTFLQVHRLALLTDGKALM